MRRLGLLLAAAMIAAVPAHGQILGGGGIGGGLGGGLGGGVGGIGGNLGGNIGGGVGGTLRGDTLRTDALRDAARADRIEARRIKAEQRRLDRTPATGGSIVGSVDVARHDAGAAIVAERSLPPVQARDYLVRRDAAVTARGLRVVGRTTAGVAVYLPTAAVSLAAIGGGTYPVGGGYVGGGGDVVVVPDGGYMDRQYRDLQGDVAGTGVTIERRGPDLVLQLPADVTFAFDHADIQPRFVPALDAVARTIADYRGTDVEIIGHTDSVGSDAYNYALSQRRGESVADFLVSRSAEPDRLIVEGMGKTEPIASNTSVSGRAANRRVEIILHPREA